MTDHTDLLEQSFELNLNNYGPEDVERLNDWAIKAYAALEALQAEVKHLNLHLKATQSGRDAALARLAELEKQFADAAKQQPSVLEGWKQAVALAYGHLWHVNNEPMAPIPLRSSETAAYEARKQLRDLLTHEERGLAINQVQALLAAAPQPKETK